MPAPDRRRRPAPQRSAIRMLVTAEVLSGAGDGVFWVALVSSLAGAERFDLTLTLAVVARLAPRAFLSVAAGSLADRAALQRLVVVIDVVRAALMGVLAWWAAAGGNIATLLLVVLASYVVGVPTRPAISAALPHLAGESRLAGANASLSTVRQVMTFVGPLLGVPIVAWSVTAGFVVNAVSFIASAVLLALTRGPWPRKRAAAADRHSSRAPQRPPVRELLRATDGLTALVALVAAMYVVRGAELVLHVLIVRDLLGADPSAVGYLAGAVGLGAVVSTPLARRMAYSDATTQSLAVALALTCAPTAVMATISTIAGASALLALVGAGMVMFEVVSVVTVQRVARRDVTGATFGVVHSVSNGGKLAGAVLAPVLAAVLGVSGALVAVAATVAIVGALALRPVSRLAATAAQRRQLLEPTVRTLAGIPLFAATPRVALEVIAGGVRVEHVSPGAVVVAQGEEADDLYVVRSGSLDVLDGESVINTVDEGEWFGEIGLIEDVPRTATVRAATACTLWQVPGGDFLAALEASGAPPAELMEGIADRLARSGAAS